MPRGADGGGPFRRMARRLPRAFPCRHAHSGRTARRPLRPAWGERGGCRTAPASCRVRRARVRHHGCRSPRLRGAEDARRPRRPRIGRIPLRGLHGVARRAGADPGRRAARGRRARSRLHRDGSTGRREHQRRHRGDRIVPALCGAGGHRSDDPGQRGLCPPAPPDRAAGKPGRRPASGGGGCGQRGDQPEDRRRAPRGAGPGGSPTGCRRHRRGR